MNFRFQSIAEAFAKVLLVIAIFVALYAPAWVALGGSQGSVYLIVSLLLLSIKLIWSDVRSASSYSITKASFALVAGFLLVIFVLVQQLAVHGAGDFTLPIQLLVAASAGCVIGFLIHKKFTQFSWNLESLLIAVTLVTAVQSLCIVLDWWSPAVRSFFETLVVHPTLLGASSYIASGCSSSTGDGLAFLQVIGAAFCFVLLIKAGGFWPRIGWSLIFWLHVISIMFLARTGFVLLSVFLLAYLFLSGIKLEVIRAFIRLMGVLGGVAMSVYIAAPEIVEAVIHGEQIRFAFEFLFKFIDGGVLETDSSNELLSMFVLPQSDVGLWFGSGYFEHMGMDPGYIRTIWAVGILGSVVIYGWYFYLWLILLKFCQHKETKAFITSFFIMLFVSHLKFPFLYLTPTFLLLSLLYWMLRETAVPIQPKRAARA